MMFVTRSPMGDIDSFHWLGVRRSYSSVLRIRSAFDKEIGVAYRLGPLHIPAIKLMYLPETGDFSACYLNGEHYPIYSYHRLYDYLDSLLIDYRGLIGEGLAVSNHAVKCDPYE